jgi:phospholipid transport system substrate-binding protein
MYKDFAQIFLRYADVPTVARYCLGQDARRASPAQLKSFTAAYVGYISRKYGSRFREFAGGAIDVQAARPVKSYFEVKSIARLQGESPFEVTFLVSDKTGKDLFFDMYVEGVSMLKSERTEIGAMIDRRKGDLDGMIVDLNRAG